MSDAPRTTAKMQLTFWGVRGSIPTPGPSTIRYGGNTTCMEIRANREIFVIDAGTGIRLLGQQLIKEFENIPFRTHLLISHTHWDHIQGFPFFSPAYVPNNFVDIYGYSGSIEGLRRALMEQMKTAYFPVSMDRMSDIRFIDLVEHEFAINEVMIKTVFTNHPGKCTAYRLETDAGCIVSMTDHELYAPQYSKQEKDNPNIIEYAKKQDEDMKNFVRNADILVADTQYDLTEYPSHVGWGHSCVDDVVEFALDAQVKRLFLFHHDPIHDDAKMDSIVEHARQIAKGSSLQIDAAQEGMQIVL